MRLSKTVQRFLASETGSSFLLIGSVMAALFIANSPVANAYDELLKVKLGFDGAGVHVHYSLLSWINDGLMAIFFLLVGLEIKRELIQGELASFRQAILPVLAAFGGVLIPTLIYALFNRNTPTAGGWGIPMATDIAFALAIIKLLGNRVPASLNVFLATLAIVDDLCAILVIALFYATEVHLTYLTGAGCLFTLLVLFNRSGIKHLAFYLIPGILMWYCLHQSGIHATIAGVLTALTLPTRSDDAASPLEKLEHALLKPVNFVIMPLFALANTTIRFQPGMVGGLTTPMGLGILVGLMIGKPLGISLFTWAAVKAGLSSLPTSARWAHIIGMGLLGGIGFTMSIFIALLSFPDQGAVSAGAKFVVLTASIGSGIFGFFVLKAIGNGPAPDAVNGQMNSTGSTSGN